MSLDISHLTYKQRRGVAGLCACILSTVYDGSIDRNWSKSYLKLLIETFLQLESHHTEAFLPLLETNNELYEEAGDVTLSSNTIASKERINPTPFVELINPKVNKTNSVNTNNKNKSSSNWFGVINTSQATTGANDTLRDSSSLQSEPSTSQIVIVKQLLWFTVHAIGYDSRARTMLRRMMKIFNLPWSIVTSEEASIGIALFAEATGIYLGKKESARSIWDWKRNAKIGAAAVTGGALLAITGGLAAPAIAASLTALGGAGVAIGTVVGSAAGVTATTVLFGTAGAGVVGMKTDTRLRGVHEFSFDLVTAGSGMNVYICVSGWLDEDDPPGNNAFHRSWGDSREYLRAFYRQHEMLEKVNTVDQLLERYKGREDELFGIMRKTYNVSIDDVKSTDPLGMEKFMRDRSLSGSFELSISSLSTPFRNLRTQSGDDGLKDGEVDEEMKSSNTKSEHDELSRAWRWKDRFPQGDQYVLLWEEATLRKFGKQMRIFAKQQIQSMATSELVKYTAFAALFTAIAIPRTLMSAADMIDNVWVIMMNNADESGELLAQTLKTREQGLRPVTLVGYGMGARLVYSCLQKLASDSDRDQCVGIVENAVLLGTPVPVAPKQWQSIREIVSGRLINGFSENDWMLSIMYRYQGLALNSLGIGKLDIDGVENVDLSDIISGHLEYKNKIGAILDRLQLET